MLQTEGIYNFEFTIASELPALEVKIQFEIKVTIITFIIAYYIAQIVGNAALKSET